MSEDFSSAKISSATSEMHGNGNPALGIKFLVSNKTNLKILHVRNEQ